MTTPGAKPSPELGWFYGWLIVAVSFLSITMAFGIRLSFTVFFVALIDDFGWSRADTALIFSANMLVFAATSTLAGMALDRWGVQRIFGLGAALLALGLALSSRIQLFWQLLLAYGGVASLGITILGLGLQASVIARWFRKRRGLAIGIAFAGTGVGSLLIVPGVEALISTAGWRAAYLALAGMSVATIPIIVLLMRSKPADLKLQPDGQARPRGHDEPHAATQNWSFANARRTPAFWLLLLAGVLAIGPVRMLTVHQLAIMTAGGFPRAFAALVIGLSGAITAIAFILSGALSDRINRTWVYVLGSLSVVLAMLILQRIESQEAQTHWALLYALCLGLGEGSRSSLITAVASDLFPGRALGSINGAIGASFGLGAAFFPWIAGWLYDLQFNYTSSFLIAGLAIVLSAGSLLLAARTKTVSS